MLMLPCGPPPRESFRTPDALGYDSSLGFNEIAPNPNFDTALSGRLVDSATLPPAGLELTDTLLAIPSYGAPRRPLVYG